MEARITYWVVRSICRKLPFFIRHFFIPPWYVEQLLIYNDLHLKSTMARKSFGLTLSGRSSCRHPSEKSPTKNWTFQLVINKTDDPVYYTYAENTNVFSAVLCCLVSSIFHWLLKINFKEVFSSLTYEYSGCCYKCQGIYEFNKQK